MPILRFKACYVAPILSGEKCDTIRATCPRWGPGTRVAAVAGGRAPFAWLRISTVEPVRLTDLPASRQATLRALYPGVQDLVRIAWDAVIPAAEGSGEIFPARREPPR